VNPTMTDIELGARALIVEHALKGWHFEWDNATVRAGACHYRTKRITLSRSIFSFSETARDDWRDVVLHEIAHALVGGKAGHGPTWRATARSIGCRATRCHSLPTAPRAIVGRCTPGCQWYDKRDRDRMPKRALRCRACRRTIEWWHRGILDSGVIDAGLEAIAASALASTVEPDDAAARRSAAARKAWATRRRKAAQGRGH